MRDDRKSFAGSSDQFSDKEYLNDPEVDDAFFGKKNDEKEKMLTKIEEVK